MKKNPLSLNQQIQDFASIIIDSAAEMERNRLAMDLHDSLGQLMMLSTTQLKACADLCLTAPHEAKTKLNQITNLIREGLTEIRQAIIGLSPMALKPANLITALEELTLEYQSAGLAIDLTVEGAVYSLEPDLADTVYRICQEALTNSLKHGKANQVLILLRFQKDILKIFILDDGCGCKTIKKGLGLSGMEQRINGFNGAFFYGSDGERGFNIRIELPVPNNYLKG